MNNINQHRGNSLFSTFQRFNVSTFSKIFRLVLMFFIITILSSCIEYREEMWLEKDNPAV